jgi:hypothetical protein
MRGRRPGRSARTGPRLSASRLPDGPRAVTFCDFTGVGALIKARDAAAGCGISLRTINPRGSTRRVMQLTGALAVLGDTDGGYPR